MMHYGELRIMGQDFGHPVYINTFIPVFLKCEFNQKILLTLNFTTVFYTLQIVCGELIHSD